MQTTEAVVRRSISEVIFRQGALPLIWFDRLTTSEDWESAPYCNESRCD